MAEFNPSTGANAQAAPDFSGASRGTGGDKSFETLFSGIGETIEAGVQTADNYIQNSIEDDARYGFDALNDETNLSVSTVPQDITNTSEGLSKLAAAHNQGKVTSEYYYQRLASQLKGLRAKYPGYEKEVDDIVQKVTGTRPANAFRDSLLSNIESANRAAASSQDKFDSFVTQSGNIGYIQMAFPDYFDQPGKYTQQEVYAGVARLKGKDQEFESQKNQMENNKAFATQAVNQRFGFITSSLMDGASKTLGVSGNDFLKRLNTASAKGGLTPDEKAALSNQFNQFIFSAESRMIKDTSDPAFIKQFSSSELQTMRQAALAPLRQIKELIDSDDYSQAAMVVARNNNAQNQVLSGIYKADPNTLAAAALSKISPELANFFTQEIMLKEGGAPSYAEKVGITDIAMSIAAGDDTINQATQRIINNKNAPQSDKNKQAASLVDTFTTTLKSGKGTSEDVSRIIKQNYAGGDDDIFQAVDSSTDARGNSQYLRLYNQMFSPEITKSVVATGDEEALKIYTDAAVSKFQAIPEFRSAAAELQQNIDYSKFARVNYDPAKNRVVVEADETAINSLPHFSSGTQRLYLQRLVKAKDSFNQALGILAPIIEANGGDETQAVKDLTNVMALELGQGKGQSGGFFDWISRQIDAQGLNPDQPKETGTYKEVGATSTGTIEEGDVSFDVPMTDTTSGVSAPSGDVLSGLVNRGLPEHVARGIVANLRDESGLRTDINEANPTVAGSRGGYGLAQWTGPRRRALENYAADRGQDPSDLDIQLDFLMNELNSTESAAYRRLLRASNASEAAVAFLNHFERPAERHRQSRELAYASLD